MGNPIPSLYLGNLQCKCHCQHVLILFTSSNPFHMYNKVFSLNSDMANPDSLLFLGNAQWKLVTQYKNSDL